MYIRKFTIFLLLVSGLVAQNIQLHYEAGESRKYFVTTLEMFQPDDYGATFWFVDMEYNAAGNKAMSLGYWELARYFNLPLNNLSATLQYNDGVATFGNLGQVWLAGVSYYLDLGFIALPVDVLYRRVSGSDDHDMQITATWVRQFMHDKLEFSGFLDVWSQNDWTGEKEWVLLAEPQLWYLVNEKLSLGSEVEISKNFVFGESDIQFLPTVGLRWIF